jgi:integrase
VASELRLRAFLTPDEVAALLRAARKGRHGVRNHAMILIAYRHGLRASEVTGLRVSDLDLKRGTILKVGSMIDFPVGFEVPFEFRPAATDGTIKEIVVSPDSDSEYLRQELEKARIGVAPGNNFP